MHIYSWICPCLAQLLTTLFTLLGSCWGNHDLWPDPASWCWICLLAAVTQTVLLCDRSAVLWSCSDDCCLSSWINQSISFCYLQHLSLNFLADQRSSSQWTECVVLLVGPCTRCGSCVKGCVIAISVSLTPATNIQTALNWTDMCNSKIHVQCESTHFTLLRFSDNNSWEFLDQILHTYCMFISTLNY